jgi:HxlR-like helix-turn-helix
MAPQPERREPAHATRGAAVSPRGLQHSAVPCGTGRAIRDRHACSGEASSARACRRIGWRVLNDRLRWLERSGDVVRQEVPGVPCETRYRRASGRRLVSALSRLDRWYDDHEPGEGAPALHPAGSPAGNLNNGSGSGSIPACP